MTTHAVVINDSCLTEPKLPKAARSLVRANGYKFVFCDPPFNIKQPYRGFIDSIAEEAYEAFTLAWMEVAWKRCDGVLALHGPDKLVEMYLRFARTLGFADRRIAWVNLHYRFGQCNRSNWIDARTHCLLFARHNNWTWNPDDVLVDSDRASKYNDARTSNYKRGGKRVPGNVWGVDGDGRFWGRVVGNSKERRSLHPNQLPEVYMERLIKAYTHKEDWVLDMFGGSGTTATVASALKRNSVTFELSLESAMSIRERIKEGAVRC